MEKVIQRLKIIDRSLDSLMIALDTLIDSMRQTLELMTELKQDTDGIKIRLSDETNLLKFINEKDVIGSNYSKQELFSMLGRTPEEPYMNLLKSGEIFEIKGKVYPLTTRNKIEAE